MPFKSRLRNYVHSLFEFGYLVLCLSLFPYIYPNLNSERYDKWPIIVIILYAAIFLFGILTAIVGVILHLVKNENDIPITKLVQVHEDTENLDVLKEWREGKDLAHTP